MTVSIYSLESNKMVNTIDATSIATDVAVNAGVNYARGKPVTMKTMGTVAVASTVYEYALDKFAEESVKDMAGAKLAPENQIRLSKVIGLGVSHYAITSLTGQGSNAMESFYVGLSSIASDYVSPMITGQPASNYTGPKA